MAHSVVRCIAAPTVAIGVTADMPNGFCEVKSSRCEAAVLPGSYSLRHRRQKGETVKHSHAPFAVRRSRRMTEPAVYLS